MEDYLCAKGMWYWIHADTPDRISDPKGWCKYSESRDQAVGEIQCHLSPELRSVSLASADPETILEAIKAAYGASSFATRHNALQAFLAVCQESSEAVASFIAHAREALCFLQSTHPPPIPGSAPTYLLEDADRELLISVLLHGTHYSSLTTSLLAQSELTVQQVEDALKNEEVHRVGAAVAAASAIATASAVSHTSTLGTCPACTFCGKPGHPVERCFKYADFSKRAKEEVQQQSSSSSSSSNLKNRHYNRKGKANVTQEPFSPVTESAGAASVRLSSSHSSLPDAWNADTGATSHMMPRREWFKSYTPCSVSICIANGQVVFAAGRGTVEFAPVKDSRKLRPVVFSNVLHVPALNQNLFNSYLQLKPGLEESPLD
jgi:hypothetical protein